MMIEKGYLVSLSTRSKWKIMLHLHSLLWSYPCPHGVHVYLSELAWKNNSHDFHFQKILTFRSFAISCLFYRAFSASLYLPLSLFLILSFSLPLPHIYFIWHLISSISVFIFYHQSPSVPCHLVHKQLSEMYFISHIACSSLILGVQKASILLFQEEVQIKSPVYLCVLLMDPTRDPAELRSNTTAPGERSVMTSGTSTMPELYVGPSATLAQTKLYFVAVSDLERAI